MSRFGISASLAPALVEQVGKPNNLPISVKIRILDTKEATLTLVRRLCTTGVARITVHCRTTPMRPAERAIRDHLADIVKICHEADVQCYANGDVESKTHAEQLIEEFGVDGCMIATAAETNPSCFRTEGILPWKEVAIEFLNTAIKINNHSANTKYILAQIIPGKAPEYKRIAAGRTMGDFCDALGFPRPESLKDEVYVDKRVSKNIKRAQLKSQTAQAAGGNAPRVKAGSRKLNVRGVGSNATSIDQTQEKLELPA